MAISSLAGKPAEPSMLIDVPRLVTAYYTRQPDPSIPAQRVVFGTSGHRGSALDNAFNEAHILAITQAICLYRKKQGIDGPLYIGIDTHALSEPAFATDSHVQSQPHARPRGRHCHYAIAQSAAIRRLQIRSTHWWTSGHSHHRMDRTTGERHDCRRPAWGGKSTV